MAAKHALFIALLLILDSMYQIYAWSNGGYSRDMLNPRYGTHDWIAQHALDFLPDFEKKYILDRLALYLYATELPDRPKNSSGIGDIEAHHVYFDSKGLLQDDIGAKRAEEFFKKAVQALRNENYTEAVLALGIMSHYISDLAVFGNVMGSGTDWGPANPEHHAQYLYWVQTLTNEYYKSTEFLFFDEFLEFRRAYDASVLLAFDTTFDSSGKRRTAKWMNDYFDLNNEDIKERAFESINLAVNILADTLHTAYWLSKDLYRFEVKEGTAKFPVAIFANTTISDFVFDKPGRYLAFYSNGTGLHTIGVIFKKSILWGDLIVYVEGSTVDFYLYENATHTALYFAYEYTGNARVVIYGKYVIPEYDSVIIVLISALLLVIVFRFFHTYLYRTRQLQFVK